MTEDEAKTKWCPMVRYTQAPQNPGAASFYAAPHVDNRDDKCIGSACMMWREADRVYTGREITLPAGSGKVRLEKETVPGGYCGLAGKP